MTDKPEITDRNVQLAWLRLACWDKAIDWAGKKDCKDYGRAKIADHMLQWLFSPTYYLNPPKE